MRDNSSLPTHPFTFAVTKSFDTGLKSIGPVLPLRDGSHIFCGTEQGQLKLKRYNFDTSTDISCVDIPDVLWGYCIVELGGRPSLAISFG